jgi:CHASE3 domain sensor protein
MVKNWIYFLAGMLMFAALLALVSFEEYRLLKESSVSAADSFSDAQIVFTLDEILIALQRAESNRRGYVITRENEYLTNYDAAVHSLSPLLAELDAYKSIYQPEFMDTLIKSVRTKIDTLTYSLSLLQRGQSSDSIQIELTNNGRNLMASLRDVIVRLRTERRQLLAENYMAVKKKQETLTLLLQASVVAEVAVILLIIFAVRSVLRASSRSQAMLLARMNQAMAQCDAISRSYEKLLDQQGPSKNTDV